MPKSIPTNGQTNWGTALNSHLGQLMDPTYGGFNLWNNGVNIPKLGYKIDSFLFINNTYR